MVRNGLRITSEALKQKSINSLWFQVKQNLTWWTHTAGLRLTSHQMENTSSRRETWLNDWLIDAVWLIVPRLSMEPTDRGYSLCVLSRRWWGNQSVMDLACMHRAEVNPGMKQIIASNFVSAGSKCVSANLSILYLCPRSRFVKRVFLLFCTAVWLVCPRYHRKTVKVRSHEDLCMPKKCLSTSGTTFPGSKCDNRIVTRALASCVKVST